MTTLVAERRENSDKRALKEAGKIPAVMYGRKTESLPIAVNLVDFMKVWREVGSSTVFTLREGSEEHDVLVHDIQVHPITEEPFHVDFYVLEKGQTVTVQVPVELTGVAPALDLGAQVVQVIHELEVEGKAKDLPHTIEVDVSSLTNLESLIQVKDVRLPSGVTATADPEDVIATVQMPEEEPEEETVVDVSAVEVEKKGKKEEE